MLTKKSNESAENLIPAYLKGELSVNEITELIQWIKKNPSNKNYFDEYCEIWVTTQASANQNKYNFRDGFLKFRQKIEKHKVSPATRKGLIKIRSVLKYAAIFILSALLGGYFSYSIYRLNEHQDTSGQYELTVPLGSNARFSLSDGTVVILNAGSTLKYGKEYNFKKREVELTGEAYFEVKTNKEKPFIVQTAGLKIKALGTSFNIKAYPDDKTLTATLVEGKLAIEGRYETKKKFTYTLAPKEKIIFIKNQPHNIDGPKGKSLGEKPISSVENKEEIVSMQRSNHVNTEIVTSWKDKQWMIEQTSLSEMALLLERRYNVKIIYDAAEMEGYSFTGTIENESLEQVLDILKLNAPLQFELGKGLVKISIDSGQQDRFNKFRKIKSQ